MKKTYLYLPLLALCISCGNKGVSFKKGIRDLTDKVEGKGNKAEEEKLKQPDNLRLEYETITENRQSDFVIIPIRLDYIISPKDGDETLYANLLFYNPKSGQLNYMDTSYVGFVLRYEILTSQPPQHDKKGSIIEDQYTYAGKNTNNHLIFMEIANSRLSGRGSSDSFGKGNYNTYNTPSYLAVVKDDGSNFVALTPANSDVQWWSFIQDGKALVASATTDSNNNGKIDSSDKIQLFYADLTAPTLGSIIVPEGLQNLLVHDFVKRKTHFDNMSKALE